MREYGAYNLAVVLNANAKRVTPQVRQRIHELVPERNIYYSRSLEDSAEIARTVVQAGYDVVFTGGGDGTVIQFINDLVALNAERTPCLGILPLGTGNALAGMVSSGNYLYDLESYVLRRQADCSTLRLLESEGRVFPFTGLGLDAGILNDYVAVKQSWGRHAALKPLVQNVGGYFVAALGRTVPRQVWASVTRTKARAQVVNRSGRAFLADVDGNPVREFAPGEVMYQGPAIMVAAGTAPYYGYGLKIFPNVLRHPGFFEVRVIYGSIPSLMAGLGKAWKGRLVKDGAWSILASDVVAEFDREVPFQIGGDAHGYRRSVEFTLSPAQLKVLRFI